MIKEFSNFVKEYYNLILGIIMIYAFIFFPMDALEYATFELIFLFNAILSVLRNSFKKNGGFVFLRDYFISDFITIFILLEVATIQLLLPFTKNFLILFSISAITLALYLIIDLILEYKKVSNFFRKLTIVITFLFLIFQILTIIKFPFLSKINEKLWQY
jgi:hypothetical protein